MLKQSVWGSLLNVLNGKNNCKPYSQTSQIIGSIRNSIALGILLQNNNINCCAGIVCGHLKLFNINQRLGIVPFFSAIT